MKLPMISLNFFKKPAKKKRTFGKRSSSASASSIPAVSRKARRSSSSSVNLKSRKRSITYYAPSKSKFYPSEHFPSMQHRLVRHRTAVIPTNPLVQRSYSSEQQPTASIDIDGKLNDNSSFSPANGTHHTYTAKQTYACGDNDYGDIVLHQPPSIWYPQSQHPTGHKINQNIVSVNNDDLRSSSSTNHRNQNKFYPNAVDAIDSNANKLYDDNYYLNNAYISTDFKECAMQGVSIPIQSINASAVPITFNDPHNKYNTANSIGTELCIQQQQQTQHNSLPSNNIATIYDTNAKYSKSNCFRNDNQRQPKQSTSTIAYGFGLPIYGATVPFKKKSDRQRRRKVRHSKEEKKLHANVKCVRINA